jgi:hypothetical protein
MSTSRLRAVAMALLKRLGCANLKTGDDGGSDSPKEERGRIPSQNLDVHEAFLE